VTGLLEAEPTGVREEEILEALAAATSRQEVSLDQPAGADPDVRLSDLVAAPGDTEDPEDLLALAGMVEALPELEREVVVLRFFEELDQNTIAARIGFSQMHVSGCSAAR
jgi:RNA polymerase sigma-B factor